MGPVGNKTRSVMQGGHSQLYNHSNAISDAHVLLPTLRYRLQLECLLYVGCDSRQTAGAGPSHIVLRGRVHHHHKLMSDTRQ